MYWLFPRAGCILLKHPTILNDHNTFVLDSEKTHDAVETSLWMYYGTWCDSAKSIKWSIYMIWFMFLWLNCYPVNGVPNVNLGNVKKGSEESGTLAFCPPFPFAISLLTYIKIQITPLNIETKKTKVRLTYAILVCTKLLMGEFMDSLKTKQKFADQTTCPPPHAASLSKQR